MGTHANIDINTQHLFKTFKGVNAQELKQLAAERLAASNMKAHNTNS